MRGRVPDPSRQKAKGNPGKRLTKAQKILAEGNECAALIPTGDKVSLTPPALLAKFPAAAKLWAEYAKQLVANNTLRAVDQPRFAMLCVAYGQWVEAVRHLREEGCVHAVKTVSGDRMKRLSPWIAVEKLRSDQCQILFDQFGFGSLAYAKLMRDRAALAPGVLSAGGLRLDQPDASASGSPVGAMDLLDSEPPTRLM